MAHTIIVENIGELLSLRGAARQQGRYITPQNLSPIRQACLVVRKGRIAWVGPQARVPKDFLRLDKKAGPEGQITVFDAQGRTLLPAFVECHTHSIFAGTRSTEFELRNQGMSYQEIAQRGGGILSTVKATRRASENDLLLLAQARVDRFVAQGVTTLEVKSGYGLNFSTECKLLKVAQRLRKARIFPTYLGPHSVPPGKNAEEYMQDLLARDLPFIASQRLARRADIFVEAGYFSKTQGLTFLSKAKELGLGVTLHADQLTRSGGAQLAVELGAQSADHLVQVHASDIEALARSPVTAVLLPGADFYLNMAYPPARVLIAAGARVAIASDFNPGSCPAQDLSLIGVLARRYMGMTLPEVIVGYTLNAAAALGLESQLGSIEIGKLADFQLIDGDWRELFYEVGGLSTPSVWREGRRIGGNPLPRR